MNKEEMNIDEQAITSSLDRLVWKGNLPWLLEQLATIEAQTPPILDCKEVSGLLRMDHNWVRRVLVGQLGGWKMQNGEWRFFKAAVFDLLRQLIQDQYGEAAT